MGVIGGIYQDFYFMHMAYTVTIYHKTHWRLDTYSNLVSHTVQKLYNHHHTVIRRLNKMWQCLMLVIELVLANVNR